MLTKDTRFRFERGKLSSKRAMLLACGAISNAAMLSFMAPSLHAQALNTWTSSSSGNWSSGTNWQSGSAPTISPAGDANLEFNASGTYTATNNLGAFPVYDTTFDAGNGTTTLSGGDLDLYWPYPSEVNNPAFADNSTNPVTINNNVTFEPNNPYPQAGGTQEYFVMAPGATTTFNGTMNVSGGSALKMTNGEAANSSGGPGGTMIWTQPVVFANTGTYGNYFSFRIYEGTFEMGGYTIDNGTSDAPILGVDGVNTLQTNGVNNGIITDLYVGPEDYEMGHPKDVAAFYLIAGGDSFNQPVQIGDAGTTTVGGVNTSGTVTFNDFFKTLPTDGNGVINGVSQTVFFSAAAGGTVLQNFALIRGGPSGFCGASVDKVGAGTWIVAGGGDNDNGEQAYTGNTTVRDGTLELAYDDTGTNYVTLPAAAVTAGSPYYANGFDGGSLGYNDPSNAVNLGDSGTLATDNIALLTLVGLVNGDTGPRHVLHNITVNTFNSGGTTTIGAGDNGTGDFSGNILLNKSVVLTGGTGGVANFSGNITGVGGITAGGTGTVNLSGANIYGGTTGVSSGATLVSTVTGALPANTHVANNGTLDIYGNQTLASLTGTGTLNVGNGTTNTVTLATNSGGATMGGLTIAANGNLDITNNHFTLSYANGTQAAADANIRQLLKNGYNGGLWTGTGGIISTNAQGVANNHFAVGYADGADNIVHGLSSGQILVQYTLYGDADLDLSVTGNDFTILAGNLGKVVNAWDKGDFDYDGSVTGNDFTKLVGNLGKTASGADISLPASDYDAVDAFAAANGLSVVLPEPASASLILLAGVGLLHRRRQQRKTVI